MNLWNLIRDSFTGSLMNDIYELMKYFQDTSSNIIQSVFFVEKSMALGGTLNANRVNSALSAIYLFMVALVALKLCWQGYKVYVLWRDGESEISPVNMVVNSIFAICVALAFPTLYTIGCEITMGISRTIAGVFPFSLMQEEASILDNAPGIILALASNLSGHIVLIGLVAAYAVIYIILAFKMLFRGVHLLLYRLGIPFAAVGLVNSDGGIWKNYIQIYFQQLMMTLIQDFCLRLSLVLLASASGTIFTAGKTIFAIVFLICAFSTPKIFNAILQPSNGGGRGTQIVYTVAMTARAFVGGG